MMGTSVNSQTGTHKSHRNSACQLFPIFREREKEREKKGPRNTTSAKEEEKMKSSLKIQFSYSRKKKEFKQTFHTKQKKNLFLAIFKLKNKKKKLLWVHVPYDERKKNEQVKKGEEEWRWGPPELDGRFFKWVESWQAKICSVKRKTNVRISPPRTKNKTNKQ